VLRVIENINVLLFVTDTPSINNSHFVQ